MSQKSQRLRNVNRWTQHSYSSLYAIEHLRRNPSLGAGESRSLREWQTPGGQLLTQTKVWDHCTDTPMCRVRPRQQHVVWLYISMYYTHTHTPSSRAIFHVNLSLLVALLILTDEQCKILRGRMLFLMPMMAITHSSSSFFNTKRRNTVDTHVLHTCTETLEYVNNSTGLPHLQFTGKQKRKHTWMSTSGS